MNKFAIFTAIWTGLLSIEAVAGDDDKRTFGWVENIIIEKWGPEVNAKLDSGALTSSMHAEDIEEFKRNGENWVQFIIPIKDEASGEVVAETFEKPVYRELVLRGAGGEDHRPAVLMNLCIGNTIYETQVSLENRDGMNYPVLLGRRTIENLGVIDVTKTFLHEPNCDDDSPVKKYEDDEGGSD